MQNIALPQKIKYKKSDEKNRGSVIIEPCFPGYGITLGNSIRRVLLSSLRGAAPVSVKIKGIDHEFMALPHLKEDILEFILNLKQLRLKVFTEEKVKLELEVHGKKEIKAGDIKKNPEVEIVNPELVLGTLTDMSGSLSAEIVVSEGMGYEMIENKEEKSREIGVIEMDSIFSPILLVGIKVENVRVGKMTNWDKLILDIKTDGTIDPEEAFDRSVKILIDQFNAIEKIRGKSGAEEGKSDETDADEDTDIAEDEEAGKEEKKKRAKKDKE
jgi:DNA-directed RNA polymerase subunit alpha